MGRNSDVHGLLACDSDGNRSRSGGVAMVQNLVASNQEVLGKEKVIQAIASLCSVCGNQADAVWFYKTTSGQVVDKDALCKNHSLPEAKRKFIGV